MDDLVKKILKATAPFLQERRVEVLRMSEEEFIAKFPEQAHKLDNQVAAQGKTKRSESGKRAAKGGKREDLGIYFRSAWEANVARYFNFLKNKGELVKWEYETETFEFPEKRGPRNYKSDFKVWWTEQKIEYFEVKGIMDTRSRTQIKRFRIHYPQLKLSVIDLAFYKNLEATVSKLIPEWER